LIGQCEGGSPDPPFQWSGLPSELRRQARRRRA